jgi:hypothetical protein
MIDTKNISLLSQNMKFVGQIFHLYLMKYTDGSRLSSRSESAKSQKANEEYQGVRNRNSSKLTIVMTENVTVRHY